MSFTKFLLTIAAAGFFVATIATQADARTSRPAVIVTTTSTTTDVVSPQ